MEPLFASKCISTKIEVNTSYKWNAICDLFTFCYLLHILVRCMSFTSISRRYFFVTLIFYYYYSFATPVERLEAFFYLVVPTSGKIRGCGTTITKKNIFCQTKVFVVILFLLWSLWTERNFAVSEICFISREYRIRETWLEEYHPVPTKMFLLEIYALSDCYYSNFCLSFEITLI